MSKGELTEQAKRFEELFNEAIKALPDNKVLYGWVIFSLGVLSVHATDEDLGIIEELMWTMKQDVRH